MKTYSFHLKYSRDGKTWIGTNIQVRAESEYAAIRLAESKYPLVKELKITNIR